LSATNIIASYGGIQCCTIEDFQGPGCPNPYMREVTIDVCIAPDPNTLDSLGQA